VAESASMVENLRDGVRGFFHTQPPRKHSSATSSPLGSSRLAPAPQNQNGRPESPAEFRFFSTYASVLHGKRHA
jgi:hypothetical protein